MMVLFHVTVADIIGAALLAMFAVAALVIAARNHASEFMRRRRAKQRGGE